MSPDRYITFVALAGLLVLVPGPDFAVVVKNSFSRGRRGGLMASIGIVSSNVVHGTLAVLGLGMLIRDAQVVFETLRWVGAAYLAYLGAQALVAAYRGRPEPAADDRARSRSGAMRGWREGFLSNITNPKVLTFYLSVLPQFLDPSRSSVAYGLTLAYTHATLSLVWLVLVAVGINNARTWFGQRLRRVLDAATGVALLAFSTTLVVDADGINR